MPSGLRGTARRAVCNRDTSVVASSSYRRIFCTEVYVRRTWLRAGATGFEGLGTLHHGSEQLGTVRYVVRLSPVTGQAWVVEFAKEPRARDGQLFPKGRISCVTADSFGVRRSTPPLSDPRASDVREMARGNAGRIPIRRKDSKAHYPRT